MTEGLAVLGGWVGLLLLVAVLAAYVSRPPR
jgi:hypothetical protein